MKRANAISLVAGILIGLGAAPTAAWAAEQFFTAVPSTQTFYVDGKQVDLEAYVINGCNYIKLRDIGKTVGFQVSYDPAANAAIIRTSEPHHEEKQDITAPLSQRATPDYSTQATSNIFAGELTREAYNGIRDTLLHREEIIAGTYQPVSVGNVPRNGMVEQVALGLGQYPLFEIISGEAGDLVCNARRPAGFDAAEQHTQVFVAGLAGLNDREKVAQMVWYVCDRITYQVNFPDPGTVLSQDGEIPGCCMAYSYSFQFLCDLAGIPCILVCNDTHMWTMVYVDDQWWNVDVTACDAPDMDFRQGLTILYDAEEWEGYCIIDGYPEVTRFSQELLVPGSAK